MRQDKNENVTVKTAVEKLKVVKRSKNVDVMKQSFVIKTNQCRVLKSYPGGVQFFKVEPGLRKSVPETLAANVPGQAGIDLNHYQVPHNNSSKALQNAEFCIQNFTKFLGLYPGPVLGSNQLQVTRYCNQLQKSVTCNVTSYFSHLGTSNGNQLQNLG